MDEELAVRGARAGCIVVRSRRVNELGLDRGRRLPAKEEVGGIGKVVRERYAVRSRGQGMLGDARWGEDGDGERERDAEGAGGRRARTRLERAA